MNSKHNKTKVDVEGSLYGLHDRQDRVTMYDPGNLTSEKENGDQRSSNIGGQNDREQMEEETETDQYPSAMSKLAITGGDEETHLSTGLKSTCNFDHQNGVKEERTTVVPQGSYFPGSSDEAVNYISNLSELPLGRSSTPDQDEDGNQKVPSEREIDELLLALSEQRPPVHNESDSSCSSDEDSETASSDEETDGVPFNYCNIAVPLKIFELYFAIPGSAFNQWIDKLQLKEFTTLKTMLEELNELNAMVSRLEPLMQQLELTTQNTRLKELKEQKEQIRKSAIKFFCGSKTPKDENYYGNTFERLWKFAERNGLLQHQQLYPHCNKSPTPYDIINGMIREKLKEGKCSLTDAVDLVMSGNDIDVPLDRPYWPTKTNPFLAFHLYGVLENSSQLPLTLDYNGILYKLAGVIFHRSDKPSGGNDHYVVRAFDPKQEIWVYNTESDGGWEKDDGDPRTNSEHTFTLSTVVYIIAVPPESIISLSTKAQCIKPPQDI